MTNIKEICSNIISLYDYSNQNIVEKSPMMGEKIKF